jgi:hypothetical protein
MTTKQGNTKFCKICKDFGKSETEFTSHNVREQGKTVCPTLATLKCRYCGVKGHMPKFCPGLEARRQSVGVAPRNGNRRSGATNQPARHQRNTQRVASVVGDDGWSVAVGGIAPVPKVVQVQQVTVEKRFSALVEASDEEEEEKVTPWPTLGKPTSWASDSDEEEEAAAPQRTWAQRFG